MKISFSSFCYNYVPRYTFVVSALLLFFKLQQRQVFCKKQTVSIRLPHPLTFGHLVSCIVFGVQHSMCEIVHYLMLQGVSY